MGLRHLELMLSMIRHTSMVSLDRSKDDRILENYQSKTANARLVTKFDALDKYAFQVHNNNM